MNTDPQVWKAFLPYLVNAAKKVHVQKQAQVIRQVRKQGVTELRLEKLTPKRKQELEQKVKGYYVDRKYEPLEKRLQHIKRQFKKLTKITKPTKTQTKKIDKHIKNCNKILTQLKKAELSE